MARHDLNDRQAILLLADVDENADFRFPCL